MDVRRPASIARPQRLDALAAFAVLEKPKGPASLVDCVNFLRRPKISERQRPRGWALIDMFIKPRNTEAKGVDGKQPPRHADLNMRCFHRLRPLANDKGKKGFALRAVEKRGRPTALQPGAQDPPIPGLILPDVLVRSDVGAKVTDGGRASGGNLSQNPLAQSKADKAQYRSHRDIAEKMDAEIYPGDTP